MPFSSQAHPLQSPDDQLLKEESPTLKMPDEAVSREELTILPAQELPDQPAPLQPAATALPGLKKKERRPSEHDPDLYRILISKEERHKLLDAAPLRAGKPWFRCPLALGYYLSVTLMALSLVAIATETTRLNAAIEAALLLPACLFLYHTWQMHNCLRRCTHNHYPVSALKSTLWSAFAFLPGLGMYGLTMLVGLAVTKGSPIISVPIAFMSPILLYGGVILIFLIHFKLWSAMARFCNFNHPSQRLKVSTFGAVLTGNLFALLSLWTTNDLLKSNLHSSSDSITYINLFWAISYFILFAYHRKLTALIRETMAGAALDQSNKDP